MATKPKVCELDAKAVGLKGPNSRTRTVTLAGLFLAYLIHSRADCGVDFFK